MFEIQKIENGSRLLTEKFGRPTIYLDNWALNDIALDPSLCSQFISIMTSKACTLRISIMNIIELLKQTDNTQIEKILQVIDKVDSGFINFNIYDVIQIENQIINGIKNYHNPSQELTIINDFLIAVDWPEEWTVFDVIKYILASGDNSVHIKSYDFHANKMYEILTKARINPDYMKKSL